MGEELFNLMKKCLVSLYPEIKACTLRTCTTVVETSNCVECIKRLASSMSMCSCEKSGGCRA